MEGVYFYFSIYCNIEFWSLSSDYLCSYKRPSDSLFFKLGLNVSGLGLGIFHKMSPQTHHNHL